MLDVEGYQLVVAVLSAIMLGIDGNCNMTTFHLQLIKAVDSSIADASTVTTETPDEPISQFCRRYVDVYACAELLLPAIPGCNSLEILGAFPTMQGAGELYENCWLYRNLTWFNTTEGETDFLYEEATTTCRQLIYAEYLQACTERFATLISSVDQTALCIWPGDHVDPYMELTTCAQHAGKITSNLENLQFDDFMKGIHEQFYSHCQGWRKRDEFDPPSNILAACVAAPTVTALLAAILLATWDLLLGRKQPMPTSDTQ